MEHSGKVAQTIEQVLAIIEIAQLLVKSGFNEERVGQILIRPLAEEVGDHIMRLIMRGEWND